MATATTNRAKLVVTFRARGVRRPADCGLVYLSLCGRFALYKSDQLYGVPIDPVRWLALQNFPRRLVISHHRTRGAAAKACQRHARRNPSPH
jgi:hypothetical protein